MRISDWSSDVCSSDLWQAQEIAASRPARLVNEVLRMEEHTAREQLEAVLKDFEERHWQTRRVFMTRYEEIEAQLKLDGNAISDDKRQLIGAYFCHDYSYAAAALMTPSLVPSSDERRVGKASVSPCKVRW